jgi:hypothetical protein
VALPCIYVLEPSLVPLEERFVWAHDFGGFSPWVLGSDAEEEHRGSRSRRKLFTSCGQEAKIESQAGARNKILPRSDPSDLLPPVKSTAKSFQNLPK